MKFYKQMKMISYNAPKQITQNLKRETLNTKQTYGTNMMKTQKTPGLKIRQVNPRQNEHPNKLMIHSEVIGRTINMVHGQSMALYQQLIKSLHTD